MSERPVFKFVQKSIEYRVYFDPITKICTSKSLGNIDDKLPSLVVDKELYESIDFCSKYRVIEGNTILPIKLNVRYKKLELNPAGKFKSTKNNIIFAAPEGTLTPVDVWDFIND